MSVTSSSDVRSWSHTLEVRDTLIETRGWARMRVG